MSIPEFINKLASDYASYYFNALQELRDYEMKCRDQKNDWSNTHKLNFRKEIYRQQCNKNNNHDDDDNNDDNILFNQCYQNDVSLSMLVKYCKQIISQKKIKEGYMSFLFGEIYINILIGNAKIAKIFLNDLSWDGAAKSLPTIWSPKYVDGGKSTQLLDIGHARICNSMGLLVGKTKWIEQSIETKKLYIDHMIQWIAYMMMNARPQYCGSKCNNFFNNLNIDNATEIVTADLRDYVVYHVKKIINCPLNDQIYKNPYGVHFDFANYYVMIVQESWHIIIRLAKKGIFVVQHADCWKMHEDFKHVVKQLRVLFNKKRSSPTIYKVYPQNNTSSSSSSSSTSSTSSSPSSSSTSSSSTSSSSTSSSSTSTTSSSSIPSSSMQCMNHPYSLVNYDPNMAWFNDNIKYLLWIKKCVKITLQIENTRDSQKEESLMRQRAKKEKQIFKALNKSVVGIIQYMFGKCPQRWIRKFLSVN